MTDDDLPRLAAEVRRLRAELDGLKVALVRPSVTRRVFPVPPEEFGLDEDSP